MMHEPLTDLPVAPVANLTWALERTSQAMLVRAVGEVDLATLPMLWSNLKAMLEDNLNVVIDLTGIEYIDACGIQAFLDIHRLFVQSGQRFVLAQPTRLFSTMLREIAGFENAIPFFTSVAAALASFHSPCPAVTRPEIQKCTSGTKSQSPIGRTSMALDNDRNRVLASLRDRSEGVDSSTLGKDLTLAREAVERHLLYCTDYGLAMWKRHRDGSGQAVITERGRDYLVRQGL
jgi:anti-anti-sigma factor